MINEFYWRTKTRIPTCEPFCIGTAPHGQLPTLVWGLPASARPSSSASDPFSDTRSVRPRDFRSIQSHPHPERWSRDSHSGWIRSKLLDMLGRASARVDGNLKKCTNRISGDRRQAQIYFADGQRRYVRRCWSRARWTSWVTRQIDARTWMQQPLITL